MISTSLVCLLIVLTSIFILSTFYFVTSRFKINKTFSLQFGLSVEKDRIFEYQDLATDDYLAISSGAPSTGILYHFCQDYAQKYGAEAAQALLFEKDSPSTEASNKEQNKIHLCESMSWEHIKTKAVSLGVSNSMTMLIIVGNLISFMIIRIVSQHSAFKTITERNQIVMVSQFLLNFFLTGMAMHCIFSVHEWEFFKFSREWYNEVACIVVMTVLIQNFSLPFSWVIDWVMYQVKVIMDRRSLSFIPSTQKVTQEAYISLYDGTPFLLDTNYSIIIALVFVCIILGPALPLLYIGAFFGLVIIIIQDTILLGKYHPKPLSFVSRPVD